MTPERFRQVEKIYNEALDRPSAERPAFVVKACAGDDELRREVESVLTERVDTHDLVRPVRDAAAMMGATDSLGSLAERTLGSYHLLSLIGKGGMGEVYAARDIRLDRKVAIKKLPRDFISDPERVARLEREAKLLASLNHPNVAAIYELDETDGLSYLVMEFVSGETLAELVKAGPLQWRDALHVAIQITDALEAAHEKEIIHRDLKPANIKVTPEKKVKVLDFGLAKAFSRSTSDHSTEDGTIMGTPAYMSPEQVRGKPLDKRTDIWSFGCVLYEMLSGQLAFAGETISDSMARVLEQEPDWQQLPSHLPAAVRKLIERCLQKEVRHRIQDIVDVRFELEDALKASPELTNLHETTDQRLVLFGVALVSIVAAVVTGLFVWNVKPEPAQQSHPAVQMVIPLPPGESLVANETYSPFALSPDGTRLVYVIRRSGSPQLYMRRMDQTEFTPISGTQGGAGPFFSPDGRWIGFSSASDGKLKKISVNGGLPQVVCDVSGNGIPEASWGSDDVIMFAGDSRRGGIFEVPASGGKAQLTIEPDADRREAYAWPDVLPGAKGVLFTITRGSTDYPQIVAQSLVTGQRHLVVENASRARYVASGHLIYLRSEMLFAAPFDLSRMETTGQSFPVAIDVIASPWSAPFAVSNSGLLAYTVNREPARLLWVDRNGGAEPLPAPPGTYAFPRLARNNQKIAVNTFADNQQDISIYDVTRGTLTPLTSGGINQWPLWTPDDLRVTYSSIKDGHGQVFWKPADGSGPEEPLSNTPIDSPSQTPRSWSPDGESLILDAYAPPGVKGYNTIGVWIWVLALHGNQPARPLFQPRFSVGWGKLSADGRWLAYVSKEFPRSEIYLRPFPDAGQVLQVSTDGGTEPVWNPNGRELFYRNGDKMMVVDVTTQPTLTLSKPRVLFDASKYARVSTTPNYDVSSDGQRFLMVQATDQQSTTQLNVIVNWSELLNSRH